MYGVHKTCAETAAVSCGTSHGSAVSTPLRHWIKKEKRKKKGIKLVTHVEPHASAVSLIKRAENSARQAIINQFLFLFLSGTMQAVLRSSLHRGKNYR